MKEKNLYFMVEYLDDNRHKHITVVNSFSEIKSLKERYYGNVSYNAIERDNNESCGNGLYRYNYELKEPF